MANIRKSFNFRTGLQVDNDNFVVNENGLVGIGTSIPQNYLLNVHGDTRVTGLTTTGNLYAGIGTINNLSATNASIGILTATNLSIGGNIVSNLVGYAFTSWITDNGGVGLHTSSKIGIKTTTSPGAADSELVVYGDVDITGALTATSTVTASSFSGSGASLTNIPNSATTATSANTASTIVARDGSGNFSAGTVTANLTGTASLASSITSSANVSINSLSAGIVTASTRGYAETFGVGTNSPNAQLHIRKTGISSLQVTSDGSNESIITLGRSVTPNVDNGQIRFGHGNALGSYPYSTDESLDIINYDTGNLNFYLNPSGLGTAFNWLRTGSDIIMKLTSSGNLGINSDSPAEKLDVGGNIVASGSITGNTIVKVGGASTQFLKADGSVDSTSYLSSQNFTGIVTASQGFTSGIGTAVSISVIGSTLTFTVGGLSTSLTLL